MIDKTKIEKEFNRIKSLGFIPSRRKHNTGIGKTFEDYLGVTENNDKLPDFDGFEVKSQRALTSSYLTLFTKSPTGPNKANTYLRDKYGEEYEEYPGLKKLHTSIFSNKFNTYKLRTGFIIVNDKENSVVRLEVKDLVTGEITDKSVYWSYEDLSKALHKKLQALFYVNAETRKVNGVEEFHYTQADIYLNPSLENLLKLIDEGKLMVDIRIGSYKSGRNKGKTHDHGTGFRIRPSDLNLLYNDTLDID
ncbi:MvaI/BcnI restriction endonuclease family protein [Lacinutrix sp. 5H-3-7-4]|uniref:MvaI/BcnI restriction endonuclease family protein n=1 Tax=Lacinutrix sp. (strain 5H-3-7-4) TaxID=983544 RepID=UPI00020A3BB5|nr:MvaI/BcnI restriction endonuclease family protein [Lacinutrix sp. 5H-3-7-4]AEH02719.1 putative glycosyl hydrolase [Lacinutrix sp. 5H-3-7-4]